MRPLPNKELLEKEREIRGYLAGLSDSREAVEAWNQRRTPSFQGK